MKQSERPPLSMPPFDGDPGSRQCPDCDHSNPGVQSVWTNRLRAKIGLRALSPRCFAEDDLGGGVEAELRCSCRHAFHS